MITNPVRSSTEPQAVSATRLDERSLDLRRRIVGMLESSRRGHLGSALSLVEIVRVLYDDVLRYDAQNPGWDDRDRCVFSKGHGCLALYVVLEEKGFFPESELEKFCKADGILGGHPEASKVPGVEASTGALGHGLSIAAGMAVRGASDRRGYRVFAILGDGECNEGSVWEAALSIGNRRLSNLCVLVDYNKLQSYGATSEVQNLEPFAAKWASFGFAVEEIDGHDVGALRRTLSDLPFDTGKPSVVICHTTKGKGVSFAENNLAWHHKSRISDEEIRDLYRALDGD